jgi:CHAD domain-containing protein
MAKPWQIPDFDAHEPLKRCIRKILRTRCDEVFSYEQSVMADGDIESVHDMRVAARRLQTAFGIFKPYFVREKYRRRYRQLEGLIDVLGDVREEDILVRTVRDATRSESEDAERCIGLFLVQHLGRRHRLLRAVQLELEHLARKNFPDRCKKLASGLRLKNIRRHEGFQAAGRECLAKRMDKFLEQSLDVAGHPKKIQQLHIFRKSGKPLRYAMEIFRPSFGKDFRICQGQVESVLELLGEIHDYDVAAEELNDFADEIVQFNSAVKEQGKRFTMAPLYRLRHSLSEKRTSAFSRLDGILGEWNTSGFRGIFRRSIGLTT